MAPFTVFTPGCEGGSGMFGSDRNNIDSCLAKKIVQFALTGGTATALQNHTRLSIGDGGQQTNVRSENQIEVLSTFWLAQKDRHRRRGIYNHQLTISWGGHSRHTR